MGTSIKTKTASIALRLKCNRAPRPYCPPPGSGRGDGERCVNLSSVFGGQKITSYKRKASYSGNEKPLSPESLTLRIRSLDRAARTFDPGVGTRARSVLVTPCRSLRMTFPRGTKLPVFGIPRYEIRKTDVRCE